MSQLFNVRVDTTGGEAVVALSGELDLSGIEALDDAFAGVDPSATAIVIDVGQLTFMDSSGLGAIVRAKQKADAAGQRLEVRGATGAVRRLLDLVALGESIDLTD